MVAMPKQPTQTDGEVYAQSHGTTWDVYKAAGWRDGLKRRDGGGKGKLRPAIEFPTASGKRYRFTDDLKPKYDQNPGYQMCWYGLERAVKIANDNDVPFLIDCNGAASTVPAQAKGMPAFSLQSGEGTKPTQKLLTELKRVWKWTIIVAMDCDKPGREGAVRRVQEYRKAGLTSFAVDLSVDKEGADLADFVALHTDPIKVLQTLPHLFVPEIVKPTTPRKPIINNPGEQQDLAQKAVDALAVWRRDTYLAWTEVGMSLTELGNDGLLLWESWSRGSEKYREGECARKWRTFKAGAGIKLGSLFKWADEDSGKTWRPAKEAKPKPKIDDKPEWLWSQGVPFGIRAALNLYADDPVAPVLELWVEAINAGMCESDDPVDIEFLVCAAESLNRKLSEKTIRRGVNLGCGQFLSNLSHNHRIYTKDSISIQESYSGNNIKSDKSDRNTTQCQPPLKAGRKSEMYKLLPIPQIVANVAKLAVTPILEKSFPIKNGVIAPIRTEFLTELGCEPEQAEKLSADLLSKYDAVLRQQPNYQRALNAARFEYKRFARNLHNPVSHPIPQGMEYKAGCARALLDFHGGESQFPRQQLADMIGCTFRNLNAVLKRAGVFMVKEQFCEQPIKSLAHLKGIQNRYNADCRGYPATVKSSRASKKPTMQFKAGSNHLLKWADSEIKAGAELTLLYRQANKQTTKKQVAEPVEETPEPQQAALKLPPTIHQRYMIAIARVITLDSLVLLLHYRAAMKDLEDPKQPEESYAEQWVKRLTETVTPWQVYEMEGDTKLRNLETAELESYTPQAALEVLQAAKPIGLEVKDDPLVDLLVSLGGVVTEIIEHTETVDASRHNDTGRVQEGTPEISTGAAV